MVRELESQLQEQKILLKHYQKNFEHKKEVDKIILNEDLRLKLQDSPSGNSWSIAENLMENIEKVNKEISLYEEQIKPKNKFR